MGPVFYPKKSLNMGQLCVIFGIFVEFLKNRPVFEGKSLKTGTPFLAKITLKDGYGFWGLSGTPLSNSNLSTPRVLK